jgi:hypothetical protein
MKFEPGDLIEEVVDGQADARCIVVKLENHPVVPGLSDYTLYLVWAAPQAWGHPPWKTLILTNAVVESSDDDYYWRKA